MLRALVLNCTLKPSPAESSTELLAGQLLDALAAHGVTGEQVRMVDLDVKPGVETDMGDGDAWPPVREKVLDCDILVFATPTWLGSMSSVAKRVLERLDAELSETDAAGRPILHDKVAAVVVTGNEDGAHAIVASALQGLNDVGFTVPAQAAVYWNGEAMNTTDYNDLDDTPEMVASTLTSVARTTSHLASLLKTEGYPAP